MIDLNRVRGIVEAMEQSEEVWVREKVVKDYNEVVKDHPDLQIPPDWVKNDRGGVGPYVDKPDFLSKARGALHRAEEQRSKDDESDDEPPEIINLC